MKAIEVISISVTDQQRSKEFYQKLGFEIIVEGPFGGGQTWVQLGYPGDTAAITLVTWFPNMPAGCQQGLIIKTDSVEKDMEQFAANGIEFGKVDETPWGKFLGVKDPDGNTISFREG